MTLLICACAALIATVIRLALPVEAKRRQVGTLALMYSGASLMWCVDGFACLAEGEPFIELADTAAMVDDALLGLCVVALGLAVWDVIALASSRKRPQTA